MLIIFIFVIVISYSTCLTSQSSKSATHFVLRGEQIQPIHDSVFSLKNPGDLCSFLKQEKLYDKFLKTTVQLMDLKKKVQEDEGEF